jgi:DNA-nicking Smr family endonuclease
MKEKWTHDIDRLGCQNPILQHVDRHGIVDKDKFNSSWISSHKSSTKKSKSYLQVDLHGMTEAVASKTLLAELRRCKDAGISRLLLVHGYCLHSKSGEEPVLKKMVMEMLEHQHADLIQSYRSGRPKEGGEGATMVYI